MMQINAYTFDVSTIEVLVGRADPIQIGALLDDTLFMDALATVDRRAYVADGTTQRALVELLRGRVTQPAVDHGRALEALIAFHGFKHAPIFRVDAARIRDVDGELRGVGHPGLRGGWPLPFAFPLALPRWSDVPWISFVPRAHCVAERDAFARALAPDRMAPYARGDVMCMHQWLSDAALWGRDLVAFCL